MNNFVTLSQKIKYIIISVIALSIIIFLTCARIMGPKIPYYILSSGITYITMIVIWLFSIKERLIQKDIKRYIYYIGFLMIFLFTIRTIKWSANNYELEEFLWYTYYIPFILMTLFLNFISISLDNNLYQKIKKSLFFLFVTSIALIVFVLTNAFHQQVFKIIIWESNYDKVEYLWGYYLIFSFICLLSLSTLIFLFKNSKLPNMNKRIMLPSTIIILNGIYIVLYTISQTKFGIGAVEISVTISFIVITIIESLIQSGLIPSNSNYAEIFKNLDIPMAILNHENEISFESNAPLEINKKQYKKIDDNNTLIIGDKQLNSKTIKNGRILWTDNIAEINKKNEEIISINKDLLVKNELLEKQILLQKQKLILKQRSNIYTKIRQSTDSKVAEIKKIIESNENSFDENMNFNITAKKSLVKICLIGSYIKRISNIILIRELSQTINVLELQNAILESLSNYKMINNVSCSNKFIDNFSIDGNVMEKFYFFLQQELEFYFDLGANLNILWTIENNNFKISIEFLKDNICFSNNILSFLDFFEKNNVFYKENKSNDFYKIDFYLGKVIFDV